MRVARLVWTREFSSAWKIKRWPHHADNHEVVAVDLDVLADHPNVGVKPQFPGELRKEKDVGGVSILVRSKSASQEG